MPRGARGDGRGLGEDEWHASGDRGQRDGKREEKRDRHGVVTGIYAALVLDLLRATVGGVGRDRVCIDNIRSVWLVLG